MGRWEHKEEFDVGLLYFLQWMNPRVGGRQARGW